MTLCLPFLMFQGRAQEAIDQYLDTFPDAELLEIQHHPEGTEIFEPAARGDGVSPAAEDHEADAVLEEAEEELDAAGLTAGDPEEDPAAAADDLGPLPENEDPDLAEARELYREDQADEAEEDDDEDEVRGPELAEPELEHYSSEPEADPAPTSPRRLVATAQLRIGGQVLMIQDSLMRHEFGFTPSSSIAVVVDSGAEFSAIVDSLSSSGEFLMEPGDYDFAENFAWVQDRFGLSWQITQPAGTEDNGGRETPLSSQAPEW